jgi:hypothetical protein
MKGGPPCAWVRDVPSPDASHSIKQQNLRMKNERLKNRNRLCLNYHSVLPSRFHSGCPSIPAKAGPHPGRLCDTVLVMPIDDLQQAAQKIAGFLSSLNKLGGLRLKYRISAGDGSQDPEGMERSQINV